MKKIFILFCFVSLFVVDVKADSFRFIWDAESTYVNVPLNANIQNYIDIPKAKLYCNNEELVDADIAYISNGDWLYLLTDVDTSKVGDYLVWYKATERKYQPGQCVGYKTLITFHVEDLESPKVINCPEYFEYKMGDSKPQYLEYIQAVDNSGNCDISIIDNVNYEIVGDYNVIVKISDGYNVVTKNIVVSVIDDQGPKITFNGENNRIVISAGEELTLKSYFSAIDNVDGDVSSSIEYNPIDTSIEGEYLLNVSFSDTQGNKSSINITIIVIDDSVPEITLSEEDILLDYDIDFTEYDFKENISQAYYKNVDIKDDIYVDISSLKNEVGIYVIYYCYEANDELVKVECNVHLLASESPIVNTQNIEIQSGEIPNYEDYFEVEDPSDVNASNTAEVDDSQVDYSTAGVYPVYVTATNSSGLTTTETFYVTVTENNNSFDWKMIVIIVMFGYLVVSKVLETIKRRN